MLKKLILNSVVIILSIVIFLISPRSSYADYNAFTINIPNSQGGYTAVEIKQSGTGYTGPKGEYYSQFPTVAQLQSVYGTGTSNPMGDGQIQQAQTQFAQEQQQVKPDISPTQELSQTQKDFSDDEAKSAFTLLVEKHYPDVLLWDIKFPDWSEMIASKQYQGDNYWCVYSKFAFKNYYGQWEEHTARVKFYVTPDGGVQQTEIIIDIENNP